MNLIVTGMHRSGTSMIAGVLQLCGAHLGNNLLSGKRDNPNGHFEDKDFVRLNDVILKWNGGTWDNPPKKVPIPKDLSTLKTWANGWPDNGVVLWKDPRAVYTIPVWEAALRPAPLRVLIVARRTPAVIESLMKRNKFSHAQAQALVSQYLHQMKRLLIKMDYGTWAAVAYEGVLKSWRTELSGVLKWLALKPSQDAATKIKEFIDPDLNHHTRRA